MDATSSRPRLPRGERLDSWKEIAAYLKRDIRTAQRWERQEGLPVHRHVHDERGTAFAYSGEIDQWLDERTRHDAGAAPAASAVGSAPTPPSRTVNRRMRLAASAVTAVLIGAGLFGLWMGSRPRPATTPLSSLSIVFGSSERIREWGPDTALSPDAKTLVYTHVSGQLHVRRLDQLTSRAVPGTEGAWGPFFSPDGRWIGFNRAGELMKVPVDGGAPVSLGVRAPFTGGADWGDDDHIVYATTTPEGTHGLYRVAASGGEPRLVAALDGSADDAHWLTPQSISNGTVILCTLSRTSAAAARFQVVAVSVSTGARRVLVNDARHGMQISDGVLVYWRNGSLFATRLDPARLEVTGPAVPAWDGVWERVRMRSWTYAAGTLVYWPAPSVMHLLTWVSRDGKHEVLPLPPAMYHAPRVSPDGTSIAYNIGNDFSDVWRYELATGASVRLTTDGRHAAPLWTPDGTRLIVSKLGASGRLLTQLWLGGTGESEPLRVPPDFLPGGLLEPTSWTDGARTLIVRDARPSARPALWAVAMDGGRPPQPVGPDNALHGRVSPDGRWIAYDAPEVPGGRPDVYVTSYPSGRQQWEVSIDGGALPIWSRTGREVFYRRGDAIMAVPVAAGETFSPGQPRVLFEAPWYEADPGAPNYDVSLDGQRFLLVLPARPDGPERLNVVQEWEAEILRRLGDSP
jgi:serine/threonine-protein kinase